MRSSFFPLAAALALNAHSASAEQLPVVSPSEVGLSAAKLVKVDQAAQKLIDDKKLVGCVIAIARHGKIAYLKAFGKQHAERDKPMTTDAVFRIYSMTKAITSAATLMLMENGKLGLDDPVSKHLPEFKGLKVHVEGGDDVAPKREMTVRDLLRHTAGLTYGVFGDSAVDKLYRKASVLNGTLEEATGKLGKLPLLYEPGEQWVYSVATDVLGRLIEKTSGKSFTKFLHSRLFDPLGMRDTGFHVREGNLDRFTANHNISGEGEIRVIDEPDASRYLKPPKLASGGGGLVSTTRDYLRFLQMIQSGGTFQGKRYLKKATVQLMTTNQLPERIPHIGIGDARPGVGFGLGFSVRTGESRWDSGARLGEYGWGGAASTHYWTSPQDDLIVVTMEQTMPFNFNLEFGIKKLVYDAIED